MPSPTATASSATRTSTRRRWTGSCRESTRGEIARSIDREAAGLEEERERQPWIAYADSPLHDPWRYDPQRRPEIAKPASPPSEGDCTTHLSVIDRDRNMVACTQTAVAGFGSGVVVPGTGVLLPNSMVVFNPMPGAANSIAGFKRGLNNMTPVLALRDGRPFLTVGAPGGRRIMCRIAPVVSNVIDFGMSIQEAITAPSVDAAEARDLRRSPDRPSDGRTRWPAWGTTSRSSRSRPPAALLPAARRHDRPRHRLLHAGVQPTGPDEARGY